MQPIDQIRAFHPEMTEWRQDFHAHPEIGFEEHRTSDIVARKLTEFGLEVHHGIGGTGVVGVLRSGNSTRSIGLRADMDALPIHEINDLPYRSQTAGKMHACGHDGHTTMLLGAAKYLSANRNFDGTVHFIFQPAEEGLGGAKAMIDDGLFERFPCDSVFGLHNAPNLPIGRFALRPGPMMAGGSFFDIRITGRGSHGARPEVSVDPVMVACHMTTALQAIVSRNANPLDAVVVSVTAINSGDAYNVIPETAVLRGTGRGFSTQVMEMIETNVRRTAAGIAAAFGASVEVDFRMPFVPLINDAEATKLFGDVAAEMVGEDRVTRDHRPLMGSEDFSYMLASRPGAYINMGNGPSSAALHNPAYNFNDEALPYGAGVFASLVEKKLARLTGA